MQTPSDRCAVRWTRARRTERAMPACYKYFTLLLLSRLHFHAISLSCLHILNISLSVVKALIHFSTPHKIILKFRKRTMQCFDIYIFYLVRHFYILDRSTRNYFLSAIYEITVKRMFDRAIAISWEKRLRRIWRDTVLLIPVEISTGY